MRRGDKVGRFGSTSRQPECERELGSTSDTFFSKDEPILQRTALEDKAQEACRNVEAGGDESLEF